MLTLLIAAFFVSFALRLLYLQHREQALARQSFHCLSTTGRVKVHDRLTNPQCATLSIGARGGDFAIGYLFIVIIIVIGSSWLLDAIGQLFS